LLVYRAYNVKEVMFKVLIVDYEFILLSMLLCALPFNAVGSTCSLRTYTLHILMNWNFYSSGVGMWVENCCLCRGGGGGGRGVGRGIRIAQMQTQKNGVFMRKERNIDSQQHMIDGLF
jgi:hypothetical protein